MKKNISHLSIILEVLLGSLFVGGVLSLIIGFRQDEFILISPRITILNSLSLGIALLINLYFTSYLTEKINNRFLMLLLSFCMIFGVGIISITTIFYLYPSSFFYSDHGTLTYLLINLLFFISINVITSGFVIFQQTLLQNEKNLKDEKILKSQMELQLLASKINPHFLFNSLNLLVSLLKKPDKAETALINLSDLLRYQLDFSEKASVSLETELDAVKKYLSIQHMRFGEKLSYQIDSQVKAQIPPLIIQPLVENCIKHNIDFVKHLHIDVKVKANHKQIDITVLDSRGKLTPEMVNNGIGLSVTQKRVEHLGGTFNIHHGGIEISFNL